VEKIIEGYARFERPSRIRGVIDRCVPARMI